MLPVLSTYLITGHRLNTVWLEKIWKAGITAVEIVCARQHLDYLNKAQIAELGHWFSDSPMVLHALHAPLYSDDCNGKTGPNALITITEPTKSKRILMVDEIKRALEVAELIPCRYLIQHIGVEGEEYDERKLDAAFTALEELHVFARQRGVQILLENFPNRLSTAERLVQFLEMTHLDLGVCLDTGHAHMNEGVSQAFHILRDRLRSIHLNDNNSVHDTHLFPYLHSGGSIDWRRTMHLLRSNADQYPLVLEVKEDPALGPPFEAAADVFRKLSDERPIEEDARR